MAARSVRAETASCGLGRDTAWFYRSGGNCPDPERL